MKSVPLLDLRRGRSGLALELTAAFERVLESGQYILGPEVEAFETECARYLGAEHAIGVSSGTDALVVSLMALGIGPGAEVICPAYTFFATAGSIHRVGARPVFVDSQSHGFNLDPADVERKLTPNTRAIIVVHLFGECAPMQPLLALAKARGIVLIEDAAQAFGAEHQGQRAGTFGDVGCFSFFPSKNLGGFGDGGLVTTNSSALSERIRTLRAQGAKTKHQHDIVGGNFRLDALQAALLRVKLRHLDEYTAARRRNAGLYEAHLLSSRFSSRAGAENAATQLVLPSTDKAHHVFNQYVVRTRASARDRARKYLLEMGIGTEIYYPVPLHLQPCFSQFGHKEGDFPVAEGAARESFALPIFPELTSAEIESVSEALLSFVEREQSCSQGAG